MNRRAFVATTAGILAAGSRRTLLAAQEKRTRLILLGTGGGPRPRQNVAASSQVIIANGVAYVIDCGDGVARQMAAAGIEEP